MSPGKPSRLVFVNRVFPPDGAATSRLLGDLVAALAKEREVLVVCSRTVMDDGRADPGHSVARIPWGRRGAVSLLQRAARDAFFLLAAWLLLLVRLRRSDLVVAKSDPPMLHWVVSLAARLRGCRHASWVQDLYPEVAVALGHLREQGPVHKILSAMQRNAARGAFVNVAISRPMARVLAAPVAVIENWALNERAPQQGEVASWRRELGFDKGFVVAHCGTLGRAHPLEPLRQLVERLRVETGLSFLCSGGGHHYDRLATEFASVPECHFLPFQAEARLPELLALADLHIVTLDPRLEAFILPSKLMGILAAGRPVLYIGNPAGEVARLLEASGAGIGCAANDVEGMLQQILSLSQDRARWQEMAMAAAQLYREKFSRERAIAQWKAVLPV